MQTTPPSLLARGRDLAQRGLGRIRPKHVQWLAVVTTVAMFLVYVTGTVVTGTQSGQGCGNSWPLCGGRFVPEFAFHTAVEFTHRVVTGLITFLVIGLAAGSLHFWRSRAEIRVLAPLMMVALLAEAFLGALIVAHPKSPVMIGIHFGSSLVLFASILLTTAIVNQIDGWDRLRDLPVARGLRWLALSLTAFTYVVGYLGAYLRVTGNELVCNQWPLCRSGLLAPSAPQGVIYVLLHRYSALILTGGVVTLFLWTRKLRAARPDLYRGAQWALGLVLAQALVGAAIVFTKLALVSTLAHAALVTLLFATLSYVSLHTFPRAATRQTATIKRGALGGASVMPTTGTTRR